MILVLAKKWKRPEPFREFHEEELIVPAKEPDEPQPVEETAAPAPEEAKVAPEEAAAPAEEAAAPTEEAAAPAEAAGEAGDGDA